MAFTGRETELQFLEQHYAREGSRILVVYGQKGVGKTTLLAAFGADKSCAYYLARPCSDREQRGQWARELRAAGRETGEFPSYGEIFRSIADRDEKMFLVVDEFHHIIKNEPLFFPCLNTFLQAYEGGMTVVLCSSATGWVENSMVGRIGSEAAAISGFLKVKEVGIQRMQEIFPAYSEDDIVQLYAVLGGNPGFWNCLDDSLDAAGNLIRHVLDKYSRIYAEMSMSLTEELREPAVYNTILAVMASGNCKLNDIYHHTGFSRAKISVYLKNLMELDIVDKVGAGTYRISRPYVKFYFRFLFPNLSRLEELTPERFFAEVVEDPFPGFVREAYRKN